MNEDDIITDYTTNNLGLTQLCSKYHIGKLKIKRILMRNNIQIKPKGAQPKQHNYKVVDHTIEKYKPIDGFHYVAKYKSNGVEFLDYMNHGGYLTSYIKKMEGIPIPNLYARREYYKITGNYWWEQFFEILLVKNEEQKKCPYCDWTTCDVMNKSGSFAQHITQIHNKTSEEYLSEFPDDIIFFKKFKKLNDRKSFFSDKKNYVICPLCGEKLKKITLYHLQCKHGISMSEFRKQFPSLDLSSETTKEIDSSNFKLGNLSVSKNRFISKYEHELQAFLRQNNIDFMPNRQLLGGKEIDILIESKRIGIEFNGLKWHTELFGHKDKFYHLNKTLTCNEYGYKLIHIFEDEYVQHKDIVYSKLRHLLGLDYLLPKIGGRKITVKDIYSYEAKAFLNHYHIQGFSPSSVYLGGYFNDELIAVMAFKHGNLKNKNWELTRFATKDTYIYQGVASKMFKHFTRTYSPQIIISFADRRWTIDKDDNLYVKLGFRLVSENAPDYRYYSDRIDKFRRFHKMAFNKKKLSNEYGFPINMTEKEMTKELGLDRIWDCGLLKFVWEA